MVLPIVSVRQDRARILGAFSLVTFYVWWLKTAYLWWKRWRARQSKDHLVLWAPLRGAAIKLAKPWGKDWLNKALPGGWMGHCPSCKRPVDAILSEEWGPEPSLEAARGRYCYVIVLWGASAEYLLGALVLGHSIRATGSKQALVCLHANDVPKHYIELLSNLWDCRLIEHIPSVPGLSFADQEHRFAKVFTKLRVLELVEFEKVLLLDIDLLVMSNIDHIFELQAPAAMRRGMNEGPNKYKHGHPIEGQFFFEGTDTRSQWTGQTPFGWGQATGINAGVMLLQPDKKIFQKMCEEIIEPNHPSHIQSNGPEQDYLSRFYADRPWTHIGVEHNYQLHQMFFALQPERTKSAERAMILRSHQRIKVVHFSGTALAKPWQRILHKPYAEYWPNRDFDADYTRVFAGEFAGYWLWVKREADAWSKRTGYKGPKGRLDIDTQGMFLADDGHIYRQAHGDTPETRVNIPKDMTDGAMALLRDVLDRWFDNFEELQRNLGVDLQKILSADTPSTSSKSKSSDTWTTFPSAKANADYGERAKANGGESVIAKANGHDSSSNWSKGGGLSAWNGLRWQREPKGWWYEESRSADDSRNGVEAPQHGSCQKVSVVCSAANGLRFVQFAELDRSSFEDEGEDLAGVFVKVVGCGGARRYGISSADTETSLTQLRLWVNGVEQGATVLLAIIGVDASSIPAVLHELAPLGVPQEIVLESSVAFAAVCERPHESCETVRAASHASNDVAYASLPVL